MGVVVHHKDILGLSPLKSTHTVQSSECFPEGDLGVTWVPFFRSFISRSRNPRSVFQMGTLATFSHPR